MARFVVVTIPIILSPVELSIRSLYILFLIIILVASYIVRSLCCDGTSESRFHIAVHCSACRNHKCLFIPEGSVVGRNSSSIRGVIVYLSLIPLLCMPHILDKLTNSISKFTH
jgi:hypothetical protein